MYIWLQAEGYAWITLNEIPGQTKTESTHIGIGVDAEFDHNVIRYNGQIVDENTQKLTAADRDVVFWLGRNLGESY